MKKEIIVKNVLWRILERCGAQGITLIVSLVLARLLSPVDYGTVSLVLVFITIMEVFVDGGLGNALIQKKDADELDFSSVFIFNIFFCVALYGLMFLIAPVIASFYNNAQITSLTRVMSLILIISGLKNIQIAYISRNMLFKKFFFATSAGTITAAVVGIVMAYAGCGVWALVFQNLVNQIIDTIILWITVPWRPKKQFSWVKFKKLYSFAWRLLATKLIDTVYEKIQQLVIGKTYTNSDLAYFNQGQALPYAIVSNVNTAMESVLLPSLSKEQDDKKELKVLTKKAMTMSLYVMAPLLMGMAAVAEPIVRVILTDKWLPCVFFIRITCMAFLCYPINTANINAIKAMGRSDIVLKLEIAKKIVGIAVLVVTFSISTHAIAWGMLITSIMSQIMNSVPNKYLLNYGYFEQLRDILPSIVLSIAMFGFVSAITVINTGLILQLFIQIIVGIIIYMAGSKMLKLNEYEVLKSLIKSFLKSNIRKER